MCVYVCVCVCVCVYVSIHVWLYWTSRCRCHSTCVCRVERQIIPRWPNMQLASDVATSQTAAIEESKWVGFPIRAFIIKQYLPVSNLYQLFLSIPPKLLLTEPNFVIEL